MKKISTLMLTLLALLGSSTVFAQLPTPLYAGFRSGNQLQEIDTTGGSWTVVSTMTLTSDLGGFVNGVKGIAMDPTDEQMYVLYGNGSTSPSARRIGQLDPMTGSITDVGPTIALSDIDFGPDGQLYGIDGTWDGSNHMFTEVDKTTGAMTDVLIPTGSTWGSVTIGYDPFNNEMLYTGASSLTRIDLAGPSESGSGFLGYGSEKHGLVVLDDNTAWIQSYGSLYEVNTTTGATTFISGIPGTYHSMGFGPTPCEDIIVDVSSYAFCEGEEVTLTGTSLTGGTITWSDGVENGVAFDPGLDGTYEYYIFSDSEADCPVDDPIVIEVIGLPTVVAGAGDLNFCVDESITLSAAGDAHLYEWNDGAELDLMPGVGEYTFTLTGYYTEGGCLGENDDEVTVTVHELPTITASASDDMICIGSDVTLNGGGGAMYEWDMGVMDGVEFSPNTIGTTTYTVTGWDEFGCEGMATVDVEVVDEISISLEGITLETEGDDGIIDITVTGGAPAYTFDWNNDGTGDFDDTEDLTGVSDGFYTVVVMGAAGCEATAMYYMGSQLSIEDETNNVLSVYPNPTVDMIQITMGGNFQYELVGLNGQILISGTAVDKEELSLDAYASGVYFVNVTAGENTSTVKVVKK
ncbi:MAG: T9SS type A sorting domain-containing protein [Crocinitomicaceae bacterium]